MQIYNQPSLWRDLHLSTLECSSLPYPAIYRHFIFNFSTTELLILRPKPALLTISPYSKNHAWDRGSQEVQHNSPPPPANDFSGLIFCLLPQLLATCPGLPSVARLHRCVSIQCPAPVPSQTFIHIPFSPHFSFCSNVAISLRPPLTTLP